MTDSERTLVGVRASRGHARPGGPSPYPNQTPTTNVRSDPESEAIEELESRGVLDAHVLLKHATPDGILGACRWFDSLSGAGVGVLVNAVKDGGKRGWEPKKKQPDAGQRAREYGWQIADWLNEHFPELKQASGLPHPAAIASVINLHYRDGKGNLTKQRHGPEIRAAVKAWKEKWGE